MSFSGKKYRRTGGSNLDEFFNSSNVSKHFKKMLMSNAPIWCFTLLDPHTIRLELQADGYHATQDTFKLGVEHELTKVDGSKIYMTVTLEGNNVLKQKLRKPNGRMAYFRREFHERTATMTIAMDGEDNRRAHVFYEVVD